MLPEKFAIVIKISPRVIKYMEIYNMNCKILNNIIKKNMKCIVQTFHLPFNVNPTNGICSSKITMWTTFQTKRHCHGTRSKNHGTVCPENVPITHPVAQETKCGVSPRITLVRLKRYCYSQLPPFRILVMRVLIRHTYDSTVHRGNKPQFERLTKIILIKMAGIK